MRARVREMNAEDRRAIHTRHGVKIWGEEAAQAAWCCEGG